MDPTGLRLQGIRIACEFPESPIFWERVGSVVIRHMENYDEWRRTSRGFVLRDVDKGGIALYSDRIETLAESLSPDEFKEISQKTLNLIDDLLNALEVSGLTDVEYRCRFFLPVESPSELVPLLLSNLGVIPDQYAQKYTGPPVDFVWGVIFPYKRFWCESRLFIYWKKEVKELFPISYKECGNGGLLAVIAFGFPSPSGVATADEVVSLKNLTEIFRAAEQEAYNLSRSLVETI